MNDNFILFLNGASSSGKTSIVKKFIETYDKPILEISVDNLFCTIPNMFQKADAFLYYGDNPMIKNPNRELLDDKYFKYLMEIFPKYISGYHRAIAAFYEAGNNVIVDHVLQEDSWHEECADIFCDKRAYFIGIDCPLDILLDREIKRADRPIGMAEYQYPNIHGKNIYDFRLDTTIDTLEECVKAMLWNIKETEPKAFSRVNKIYKNNQ